METDRSSYISEQLLKNFYYIDSRKSVIDNESPTNNNRRREERKTVFHQNSCIERDIQLVSIKKWKIW